MENSSIVNTTATTESPSQLPISITHQHQYPTHDPTLAQLLALISQNLPILREITKCNSSGIPTTQPAVGQLVIPISENEQHHSTTIEFQSPESQNEQPLMTTLQSIAVSTGDEDQSIDLRLTELRGCSDPKNASNLFYVYLLFLGLVGGKSVWEKHTLYPLTKPFMIISIVVSAIAYLNLIIWSCMYNGLKTLPRQDFSPGHYKISKYAFYILCFLAYILLLPVLFISKD